MPKKLGSILGCFSHALAVQTLGVLAFEAHITVIATHVHQGCPLQASIYKHLLLSNSCLAICD